jgi:hypothetical protein
LSPSIDPILQAQRIEEFAFVQSPKDLGKAMQVFIRPNSDAMAFLERAAQQRNGHVADLAEL